MTAQQAAGITVDGRFRDLDDPDRFVCLRALSDMAHRRRALEAFCTGPAWREHRDAANATMTDSDDVLLLPGPGFTPEPGTSEVLATACRPADAADFDAYAARHLSPGHALHRTEHAENDLPRLPVPTREDARIWFDPADPPPWPTRRLRLEPVKPQPAHSRVGRAEARSNKWRVLLTCTSCRARMGNGPSPDVDRPVPGTESCWDVSPMR
ncbi:NIPSNAP family protein [Streptomyces sp. SAS_272]|uniref:NIPSNAP family protein n=1 Tax=Streptomyces sp. SAS_272 TaxID=3412747 RepID=UPI00403D4917